MFEQLAKMMGPQLENASNGIGDYLKSVQQLLFAILSVEKPPENYNAIPGAGRVLTAPDTYDNSVNSSAKFGLVSKRIDVFLLNNDAVVSFSVDGSTYGDDFVLPAPSVFSFPFRAKAFRIHNRVAAINADWQVVFWA